MIEPVHGNSTSFPLRLWTVSWKLVLSVGLFFALYIPFVLPYILYPQTEYSTLATARGRFWIELIAMVTVVLAAFGMTRYVDRKPLSTVGFASRTWFREFGGGTLAGVALVGVVLVLLWMLDCIRVGTGRGPFNAEIIWTTLALFVNTIHQETLVHGYVQQMVRKNFGSAAGVLVSSFLLVVMHWTLFKADALLLLTNLFAVGVFLGIAFLFSRTLWVPIGIHFGWNYVQGPLLGLPLTGVDLWDADVIYVVGSDYLTGGSLGLEAGIVATVVLVLAAAWMYRKWMAKLLKTPSLEQSFP